jgi:hypothetical protein
MIPGTRYTNSTSAIPHISIRRSVVFGSLIVVALVAFELFNFSTTEFALRDILGGLRFTGIPWATILAIAFCGIDFAGLARMFTPEVGVDEPREVWYLFGAWMLAALMNAMLTWWGVSIAIYNHDTLGNGIVARRTLLQVVPVFVAIMVWLIRVLIIGTFSTTGERLFGNQVGTGGSRYTPREQNWQSRSQSLTARSLTSRPVNTNRTVSMSRSESNNRPVMTPRPIQTNLNTAYNPAPRTPQIATPEVEQEPEYDTTYLQTDPVYVPVGMVNRHKGVNTAVRM